LWNALPAGGGKNDVPNRLKRQFALFNVPLPSVAAINGIFGKLVEGRFSADQFSAAVVKVRCTRHAFYTLGCQPAHMGAVTLAETLVHDVLACGKRWDPPLLQSLPSYMPRQRVLSHALKLLFCCRCT
jgi:hypothetical protein